MATSAPSRINRTAHKPLSCFTVDHFRKYARLLVLDSGAHWELEDFQMAIAEDVFGGVPEIWLVVPEGNGKTTFLSGLGLYHCDFKQDAEVPMAASSRDQCNILFSQAAGFIRRSPGMEKRFRVYEGYRRITALRTHGRLQVFSADDRTGDGLIFTFGMIDEVHRHRDLSLYRTWRGKLDKRPGAQIIGISTAGEPGSEFEETRERARRESPDVTRVGRHTRAAGPELILHDFALDPDDDPEDMAIVKQANPFSGVTVESLTRKRRSPSMTVAHWKRFVCDVATRTEESAIGEREWALIVSSSFRDIPEGSYVDVGVDFGWKWDTTALVPLWEPIGAPRLLGRSSFLVPPQDGTSLRPEAVQVAFSEMHARTPIRRVVMDPNAGGQQFASWLESEIGCEVAVYEQTTQPMTLAFDRFMEAIRTGAIRHCDDPEFNRHVLNAVAVMLPGGRSRFDRPSQSRTDKRQRGRRVIDGLIAAAMVLSVAVAESTRKPVDRSVYFL
jgi:phage terminase large subunit-like protein